MVEKTGLKAVFETSEFQQGLQIYKQGLADARKGTDETASGITSAGKDAGGVLGLGISGGALAAGAALLGLLAIAKKVVQAFLDMVAAAKDFIVESIQLASRWQELDMVAQLMGQRVGMSSDEVHALGQEMQDAGIRADVANKAISQFVRMEMDPNMALELGKVSQNLAVVSKDGADSSETMDRLMLGIQRLSPLIIRTAGANVNLDQSFQDLKATLGITGRELTQAEKQLAAYNAVMIEGAKVAGVYEIAMDSAGKQMRSLSGREIPTLKNALGAPFQGAFLNVSKAAREVVKAFTAAIQEGGALYPMMVRLGAIADIITEALASLATKGTAAVIEFLSSLQITFGDSIQSAFEWGYELVVNFAQGIIDAAASVLVQAINFLGSVLAGWLAPGSPPKVAPDIIKWGVGAMNEYLHGFTTADFGILKNIQSPLKSAFDLMVSAGEKSRKDASAAFLGLNEDIAKVLSGDEKADEGLFARIAREAGEFGNEIADLVRGQIALAQASDDVAEAQERINDALEQQQQAEQGVRDLTDEYNRLLRAGASDEVLKAQLAQINAAEEQAILAGEQKAAAEDDLAEKEATLAIMQEQVKLQGDLVKQLLDLAKMAITPGELLPGAGAGGVGDVDAPGSGAGFEIDTDAIKDKMKEAVAAAKAAFLEKWAEVKAAVREQFQEAFGPAIAEVSVAWNEFMVVAKQFYDEKLAPVFEDIQEWAETNLPAAWLAFTEAGQAVWDWYTENMVPILEEVWGILGDIAEIIELHVTKQWANLLGGLKDFWDWFTTNFSVLLEGTNEELGLLDILTLAWKNAIGLLEIGLVIVNKSLKKFRDFLEKIRDLILNMPSYTDVTKNSPVPMAEGLKMVNAQMKIFRSELGGAKAEIGALNGMNVSSILNSGSASNSILAPSHNRVLNLQQQNNIQAPMDLAVFRSMFNQVVREQFTGA